ncbi:23807_t:CDS:2 [Gigaspora margarita]|uniref:23807_t:CDS:1 n=1 Tax=Gigaspora margarita TaxID=4874 RepID=A0ABN7VJ76_GIGMA|nr:23807_t:CDS:2 [Gigaspora margarita]
MSIVKNEEGIFVEEETIVEENESIGFEENEEAVFEENENILEENGEVTLKFYTSQSLTTNKRRALLFNVREPFEKAFACRLTKHNHSSGRKMEFFLKSVERQKSVLPTCALQKSESEVLKRSNAVRKLVEEEAVKNYSPPTIVSMIKNYATKKLDLGASVKELKQKEVSNIKQKVSEAQKNNRFGGNINIDSDIAECIHFLKNEGWDLFLFLYMGLC